MKYVDKERVRYSQEYTRWKDAWGRGDQQGLAAADAAWRRRFSPHGTRMNARWFIDAEAAE